MSTAARYVVVPFVALSAAGLLLSLVSHLAALAGIEGPLGDLTWILHVGIFVVWIPTVIVSRMIAGGTDRPDFWKVAMKNCPVWMRYMTYGFFGYAVLNFIAFMASGPDRSTGGVMPPSVVRGFSGHWMAFYSAALAILYSASSPRGSARACREGHRDGLASGFCERCGQRITGEQLQRHDTGA